MIRAIQPIAIAFFFTFAVGITDATAGFNLIILKKLFLIKAVRVCSIYLKGEKRQNSIVRIKYLTNEQNSEWLLQVTLTRAF